MPQKFVSVTWTVAKCIREALISPRFLLIVLNAFASDGNLGVTVGFYGC